LAVIVFFLLTLLYIATNVIITPYSIDEIVEGIKMKQQISSIAAEKKGEWKLFIFLTVFLFPILATVSVFGYGFIMWMSNILFGLPGHS